MSYDKYPNKKYFPWFVQVTLELVDFDEQKMPTVAESNVLNDLEDKMENFIAEKHKTHFIGRITEDGFRILFFYIDTPRFNQEVTSKFFDQIQAIRKVNFNMEKDPTWNNVSAFIN